MRILLVKTSSLGDVIHNLPVVSDIRRHLPDAVIDWCVEENFAAIPRLHPGVHEVVPVAVRRWRRQPFSAAVWREVGAARRRLGDGRYDRVVDTQGLLKSALLARLAGVPVSGYAGASAREPAAARFYRHHFVVPCDLHAVERNRRLVAAALGYSADAPLDYGIAAPELTLPWLPAAPFAVFLTATSRDDKLWPEAHWRELGHALAGQGVRAVLPGGSGIERERAGRLAAAIPGALAAPPLSIAELAALLGRARAAIGVDTGLTHLAVALRIPTVALYTATDPGLTGVLGTGYFRNLGGRAAVPAVADVLAGLAGAP
jgi:heptosyltransferase-1